MLWRGAGIADNGAHLFDGNAEFAAYSVSESGADALSHLMATDADHRIALVGDLQMRNGRRDDAGVGADRHAPADFGAVLAAHGLRRHWPLRPAEAFCATAQAFRDMTGGEGQPGR